MVRIDITRRFSVQIRKIRSAADRDSIKKRMRKVVEKPEIGKPMRHDRKGTREVYVGSYRLAYTYFEKEDVIVFLELYHKDQQ